MNLLLRRRWLARLAIGVTLSIGACAGLAPGAQGGPAEVPPGKSGAASAVASDVQQVLDKADNARRNLRALKADVAREDMDGVLEIEESWSGTLIFQAPRLLRMDLKENVKDGREETTLVGKEAMQIIRWKRKMVDVVALGEAGGKDDDEAMKANPFAYALAYGLHELSRVFDLRVAGSETVGKLATQIIEMTPKASAAPSHLKKITFWVDTDTSLPVRVQRTMAKGDKWETYTLSSLQINVAASPKVFEYRKPDGFEEFPLGNRGERPAR
jgi:outer membrane lipoprotein-sorting protein